MTFGEKLRKYRKEKGLTQAELAKLAGTSKTTIVNYEGGTTYPQDRGVYARLAGILEIDADFLHNENDEFVANASELYGTTGRNQAEKLLSDAAALFAGGDIDEEQKQEVLNALQEIFYDCKRINSAKFTADKYKK